MRIGQARHPIGPVMQLEGGQRLARSRVESPCIRRGVAHPPELILEPRRPGNAFAREPCLVICRGALVKPPPHAGLGQLPPGECRPGILFATDGDIAVADDVLGRDAMPAGDVTGKRDDDFNLVLREGGARRICGIPAGMYDFDADRTWMNVRPYQLLSPACQAVNSSLTNR